MLDKIAYAVYNSDIFGNYCSLLYHPSCKGVGKKIDSFHCCGNPSLFQTGFVSLSIRLELILAEFYQKMVIYILSTLYIYIFLTISISILKEVLMAHCA
jgi:hypothetical protein